MRLLCLCLMIPTLALATPIDGIGKRFDQAGVNGTFVLLDIENDGWIIFNRAEAERETLPASTFKILNSLIALETGVVSGADEVIPWDGTERQFKSWNRDHHLASAIRHSVVWYYQELARRIGESRMQQWISDADYGNQNISGGIDRFWLEGGLRISAVQQVQFLKRLAQFDLPFSRSTMQTVHDITIVDEGEGWQLHAKTGWGIRVEPHVGWYVGWLQRGNRQWVFATRIEMTQPEQAPLRIALTRDILDQLGILSN